MNEPRRLIQSGGVSQRLLDSASLDKPSEAARRRAEMFAGTAGTFASTAAPGGMRRNPGSMVKTLVTWAAIGAAASAALAFGAAQLLESGGSHAASAPPAGSAMAELPAVTPTRPSDIAPESTAQLAPTPAQPVKPLGSITPWAPSPSAGSADEVRVIEAARQAVSHGDNAGALATLNGYDQQYPTGTLKAESTVLRVQALSSSGKTDEAKQLASEFVAKNPASVLSEKLKSVGK